MQKFWKIKILEATKIYAAMILSKIMMYISYALTH